MYIRILQKIIEEGNTVILMRVSKKSLLVRLCSLKQFIGWVIDGSSAMLADRKKVLWVQGKHVTDAVLAVPRFGQHGFALNWGASFIQFSQ